MRSYDQMTLHSNDVLHQQRAIVTGQGTDRLWKLSSICLIHVAANLRQWSLTSKAGKGSKDRSVGAYA